MNGRKRGSHRQFDRFVAESTESLLRTAYLMTWDLAESEDLVQEVLVRLAHHWPRVTAMGTPQAYARKILVNLVIDGSAGRRRRTEELAQKTSIFENYEDEAAGAALRGIDARSQLRLLLGGLSVRQRTVIVLRYWEDLPEAEIAELLGCAVGTVKSTASRAMGQLRGALTPSELSDAAPCARSRSSKEAHDGD